MFRNIFVTDRLTKRDENRVCWLAFVAKIEFGVPPVEKFEGARGVRNFVAKVVGPTAVGVDIVKMLVKFLRQQPRNDIEIFVVMRGKPFGELPGSLRRTPRGRDVLCDFEFTGTKYLRIKRIKQLQSEGRLSASLRWLAGIPAGVAG